MDKSGPLMARCISLGKLTSLILFQSLVLTIYIWHTSLYPCLESVTGAAVAVLLTFEHHM